MGRVSHPPPPDFGPTSASHFDVVIVGAGISGLGSAHHLLEQRPDTTFVLLESQPGFGGTWRTHRYPGARSDSDLYTYGYRFKPWTGAPIATREEIVGYLGAVVRDDGLDRFIRYEHTVTDAQWSSDEGRWTLRVRRGDGAILTLTAGFLWMCQGYYRHDLGYTPEWPGRERFTGPVVHPQNWPDDLDVAGRRVVVVGSGATAATLIPALVPDCAHVTMLQRSPTYFFIGQNANELADTLRQLDIPAEWTHEIVRRKSIADLELLNRFALEYPDLARAELLQPIRDIVGEEFDVDTHFTPRYQPWRQRIALVPNGDLFHAIREGRVSVVTDEIESFTDTGFALRSGATLDADVIVTATGFTMNVLGDIAFRVDDVALDFASCVTYRGLMFTGVPNLVEVFGYFRASWTLRVDLIGDFVCGLLRHMSERGATTVTPTLRVGDEGMTRIPWIDPEEFNPGYLRRALALLPSQGDRDPWRHAVSYEIERTTLPKVDWDDGSLIFGTTASERR